MARWFLIFLYSALLIGAVSARQVDREPSRHSYVTCADERVLSFGTTHRAKPIAEFAAIVRWREESLERGPGYDNWGLARERHIACRKFGDGKFLQCAASAQPCKPKRTYGARGSAQATAQLSPDLGPEPPYRARP